MDKLKQMLPYLIVTAIAFYLLPLLGRDTGSFMLILLIAVPLICFTAALLHGARSGFKLFYPLIVASLFIPTIFIYYNSTAWIYTVIYAAIALVGTTIGSSIIQQNK
ncbi:MAG: hypothetical protein JJT76_12700 [Clostridiaceae bacterium]|nr:hypothetical protein [Clostridiaceae bacterium]